MHWQPGISNILQYYPRPQLALAARDFHHLIGLHAEEPRLVLAAGYFQHLTVLPAAPVCTGSQVFTSYSTTRGPSLHWQPGIYTIYIVGQPPSPACTGSQVFNAVIYGLPIRGYMGDCMARRFTTRLDELYTVIQTSTRLYTNYYAAIYLRLLRRLSTRLYGLLYGYTDYYAAIYWRLHSRLSTQLYGLY